MLTDELVKRLAARTGETPNILAPQIPDWSDGKGKTLSVAELHLRQMGQGIIDEIHEHRHLREARVLLVVEDSEAVADKLDAGQRVVIGKASRANPFVRLLTMPGETATTALGAPDGEDTEKKEEKDSENSVPSVVKRCADFVVKLSGDWLQRAIAATGADGDDPAAARPALALIDHELLHCGARIAGEFVPLDELDARKMQLGADLVEVCDDFERGSGEDRSVLVRWYHRDKAGRYQWCMRKHDVEEFEGVARRHGAWDRQLAHLVDVLVEDGQEQETKPKRKGRKTA